MRYYTKEWYELMQSWGLADDFEKIPDGEYTRDDIRKLYMKKLKKEIADDRECYNLPPYLLPIDDMLTDDTFDPEDWLRVDEESGKMERPASAQEVREQLEAEYQQEMEEFNNRPPYDPSEAIEMFRTTYRMNLKTVENNYPDWLVQSTDHHLIALGYLPKTAYNRYCREKKAEKKRWDAINRAAERTRAHQNIPEMMEEAMELHDACLLSLRKQGKNIVMIVRKDGEWPDDDTPYRRIVFEDAQIIEKEKGMKPEKFMEDDVWSSDVSFLYHEIYEKEGRYAIHMMFWSGEDLKYLSIRCSEVTYEDGIQL